jgi:uncharacterized protein YidB (DUF937 family)
MSILDSVKQMISGQSGEDPGAMGHVMDLVNNPETGGLQGLVQQFHSNGLGSVVTSWISSGNNQAIAVEQIQQVIGQDRVNAIASKMGVTPEEASAKIAQYLPMVINKLTPGGKVDQA